MGQIKENQIIPSSGEEQSPFFAPPRDLYRNLIAPKTVSVKGTNSDLNGDTMGYQGEGTSFSTPLDQPIVSLVTPAIIGIKSQTVNISDGGKATIDVVLNVQDIAGITEFDIRIAKDARNL
jgi:hypothetical protein